MTVHDVAAAVTRLLPEVKVSGAPEVLTGGLMNFVWRIPADPHSVIVKHAPPYIATAPDVPLDASRITFEARCLQLLGEDGRLSHVTTPMVRPPALFAFDPEINLLIMEDVGQAPSLAQWLLNTADPGVMPAALGKFIGNLHRETAGDRELPQILKNRPIQETRNVVQYQAIAGLCEQAGRPDALVVADRAKALGERLLQPGRCLIMGDLWPASILVKQGSLRIIDWEFAHYGNPAQDVAHLAAHLWMLGHRHPEKSDLIQQIWRDFKSCYEAVLGDTRDELWDAQTHDDAAVHFGAEVLVRTVGAFQSGYLYDGLAADNQAVQEAVSFAVSVMEMPALEEMLPW